MLRHRHDNILYLLALRAAAIKQAPRLAAQLLDGHRPDLQRVTHEGGWVLTPAHWRRAAREWEALQALNIAVYCPWEFPPQLQGAHPCPVALFVRGDARLLQRPALAIVGSRKASSDACEWAAEVARKHAAAGTVVVSGGALGIDSAAHRGALAASGRTIAYVGSAVDYAYPRANRDLFRAILAGGGAIVSEHPPFAPTVRWHHAARNRLIVAQASALVVVEAAAQSGTLGAVAHARRLQRPVWVSPPGVGKQRDGIEHMLSAGWARIYDHVSLSRDVYGGFGSESLDVTLQSSHVAESARNGASAT